ncbi:MULTISPECIES: GNAT family N-acetyltransferase [unclassified Dyadobacter]|uniref:GNAT family N-acetyltransferase n=1 Tax=unclassified Dyadobacter TaxID=2625061 RepID=UPI001F37DF60|nr:MULTISPECIES: GNAT family N-acetyltransferase [unclassified Dyadobacter]MCE7069043.1 GNAT family N-acetyltransferase [Dyadobacter sp. CY327]MCF2521129.1 GNAT family N-acetyltransferase [Dyadobacter sp. CY351]
MDQITIVKAGADDLTTVQQIGRETFFETFAAANTEADMKHYLTENFSDAKMAAELDNPESHFFIAWLGDSPVGYMKLNTGKAQTELQDPTSLEIERIYVKSEFHGKKVGQLLYDKALETAQLEQKAYLWLGVWEENPKAIRFYEKNGFTAFDKHIFKFGADEQTDIMMRKML